MKHLTTALLALGLASFASGCVTRTITRFEDNQKAPVTALELDKHTNYFFARKVVHQFFLCQDTGNQLICKLSCDGSSDVVCPKATGSGNRMTTTNVR